MTEGGRLKEADRKQMPDAKAAAEQPGPETEKEEPARSAEGSGGEVAQEAHEAVQQPEKAGTEAEDAAAESAASAQLIAELQNENEQLLNRLHRMQADFDNYRKRLANEKKEWFTQAVCELISELLPVIDNLERALAAEGSVESVREGVKLVHKQLMEILGKQGLQVIEACGKEFDPVYHHAVMQVECDEPENTVVEELQKGYKVNERVIRPSLVKVAK
ncbi:MAG: nucleotide exchange factor GrpE [Firmicutes bacterium]|nr:nucleotide exchange factor GrpE [Bacillota bacterium]